MGERPLALTSSSTRRKMTGPMQSSPAFPGKGPKCACGEDASLFSPTGLWVYSQI